MCTLRIICHRISMISRLLTRSTIGLFFLFIVTMPVQANEEVQVGRYSSIQPVPTESQEDVFQTIATIEFPDVIGTVGDAIRFSIQDQGFRLASPQSVDERMEILLDLPLPKAHRRLGPMPLKSTLETLAGPVWRVVQDPVHRLVGFELCDDRFKESK